MNRTPQEKKVITSQFRKKLGFVPLKTSNNTKFLENSVSKQSHTVPKNP